MGYLKSYYGASLNSFPFLSHFEQRSLGARIYFRKLFVNGVGEKSSIWRKRQKLIITVVVKDLAVATKI